MDVVKLDISVIIVSYNVQNYLCNCIDSVLAQRDVRVEVIVIDNNSTDGTKETIYLKYPSIKFISNADNVGFSAANNQGIKAASAEVVMLLNPDTELVDVNTLVNAKNYMEANVQMAILVPKLLNTDGSFQLSFWNFHSVKEWTLELFYLHLIKQKKEPSLPFPVQAASGAALIFRKSLTDEIGGLDETMFWTEDVDFCYRAYKAGKEIIYNPDIKIIHHGGKSSVGNESIIIPNQVMSKIKFSRKYDPKPVFYLINVLSLLFICSRLFAFSLLSPINKKYNAKRKAYVITLKGYLRFNFQGNSGIIK
jgi:GT2 family glycosyltransferase